MSTLRLPAVAGQFYPRTAEALSEAVAALLNQVKTSASSRPKALAVPHAGYLYSGPVAAAAYGLLVPFRDEIHRVVLLGPAHRVWVRGLAGPDAGGFATPLGIVPVDTEALSGLVTLPKVRTNPGAHAQEHSLEVQLPFLQTVLDRFEIVPLVVGEASPGEVSEVVEQLWGGPETLFILSTDLSHYHPYDEAVRLDQETAGAIEAFRAVDSERACGAAPLNGFLSAARRRGLSVNRVALANSGDTAGDRGRVVGYGSFAFFEEEHHGHWAGTLTGPLGQADD